MKNENGETAYKIITIPSTEPMNDNNHLINYSITTQKLDLRLWTWMNLLTTITTH